MYFLQISVCLASISTIQTQLQLQRNLKKHKI